jgi:hypothetical protein
LVLKRQAARTQIISKSVWTTEARRQAARLDNGSGENNTGKNRIWRQGYFIWTMEAFEVWTLDAIDGVFVDNGCVWPDSFGLWMRFVHPGIPQLADHQEGS